MELAKYKACICEGSAENAIMDILLDNDLLIFTREEMLEEEVIRCRDGKRFEEKYLRKGFLEKISVIRILDSRRENYKLSKAYEHKVDVINVITAPEIEMLIIFNEDKYKEFKKSGRKPSDFCYRKEYPQITANASQIPWQLDDDMSAMLPVMQTDIMLSHGEKTLIIDAKYYAHSTQIQYDKHSLHSGNLYQIFTYVKNKEAELADRPHEVSGMLLYAKTDEDIYPENAYRMSGNRIEVRTLNLDGDFDSIRKQLDGIAEKYFGIKAA